MAKCDKNDIKLHIMTKNDERTKMEKSEKSKTDNL